MPFPLLPFAIKGAFVLGKMLVAKGAVATAAKGAVLATKTIGAANTLALATGACVVAGGVAWTAENIQRGRDAYSLASRGELASAAQKLVAIYSSAHTVSHDFAGDLKDWIDAGKPMSRVPDLARTAKELADEAFRSS